MRKVEIPCIYDVATGNWLTVGSLTYDHNNEIIEVEHWNGDTFKIYKKGEFAVEEKGMKPLNNVQGVKNEKNES